ncbi:MAG: M1 family metallopeptidase [bacterium]|nr:M1 family metallopeptidase [bacterium]
MRFVVVIVVLWFPIWSTFAQSPFQHTSRYVHVPGSEPREHVVDVERMSVDVRFDPPAGLVTGKVTHTFRVLRSRVDSIVFDGIHIRIRSALLGGKPVRTTTTDTTVIVHCEPALLADQVDSVMFTYEAEPRRGLYFIGWGDSTNRMRRQIWTQGQGIDHRHWIPMYDEMNDKMITETIVTFDSAYNVLSNGTNVSVVSNNDGTKTWHYLMTKPHASYLLMLAIGKYDITERRAKSGVVNRLYSYPEFPERIEPTYRMSTDAMDFLESELGVPYPWESYSQVPVADFTFGAMENTTATVFGDFFLTDSRGWLDRSYVNVNIHELTHQWFGDYITARSSKHAWLQESFATFYPHLMLRGYGGEDAYQWSRRGMHQQALSAGEKDRLPIVHPSAGTARIYPKGASVIDMMRYTFGERDVRTVFTHYLKHHAYSNVETSDLYHSFQDTLGITPDWFFDQWLYRGGEPHFKISTWNGEREGSAVTVVSVEQKHPVDDLTGYFRMPIVLEAHYPNGRRDSVRAWIDGQHTTVVIPNTQGKPPAFVLFDPGSYVLKRVQFDKSWDQRAAQLKAAPYMIDRYDALESLRADTSRSEERLVLLKDVMSKESFPAMRSEAVRQAAGMLSPKRFDILAKGLKDGSSEVRLAAISSMSVVPLELRSNVEALLSDSSYNVISQALTVLSNSFPGERNLFLQRTQSVRGPHERIRIAWLESSLAEPSARGGALEQELIDLGSSAWEFRTRVNAFEAWRRLNILTSASIRNAMDALVNPNERLSEPARTYLDAMRVQTQFRSEILRQAIALEPQLKTWRRERLQAYMH